MQEPWRLRLVENEQKSKLYYTIDVASNYIEVSRLAITSEQDQRDLLSLSFPGQTATRTRVKRFPISDSHDSTLNKLESKLAHLSERGLLSTANIVLGYRSDPFHPFKDRFDHALRILKVLKKYKPGMLIVQTRSPILVIALDILKSFGENISINYYVETDNDEIAKRITPELPAPGERLRAALALKRFGIDVNIHVSPLLPYGDWQADAARFAGVLSKHANRIYVKTNKADLNMRRGLSSVISRAISNIWGSQWLEQDSTKALLEALQNIAPEKLTHAAPSAAESKQLKMFVA